jgi:hypothetical protein
MSDVEVCLAVFPSPPMYRLYGHLNTSSSEPYQRLGSRLYIPSFLNIADFRSQHCGKAGSGALPDGLTLHADRTIVGTPIATGSFSQAFGEAIPTRAWQSDSPSSSTNPGSEILMPEPYFPHYTPMGMASRPL